MATFYHGAEGLIQTQGDSISVAMSRLATLNRSYVCRIDYTEKARSILQVGYRPPDYPFMGLAVKPNESNNGIISTFNCTFNGVLYFSDFNVPYITVSTEQRTLNSNAGGGMYLAPIQTRQYIAPVGQEIFDSIPSLKELSKNDPVFSQPIYLNGYKLTTKIRRSYYRRVNFGVVDQIDVQFATYTDNDA
jgi:hypothetical protein